MTRELLLPFCTAEATICCGGSGHDSVVKLEKRTHFSAVLKEIILVKIALLLAVCDTAFKLQFDPSKMSLILDHFVPEFNRKYRFVWL